MDQAFLPGVRSHLTRTDRLTMHWLETGPDDGEPIIMFHGNLSTSRFFEHLMPDAPDRYRIIAPDMRGFGRTDPLPLDATRGLRDWSDDVRSLLATLGVDHRVHLVGWSTGGAAISHYAEDHGNVASLTYVDPVSPFGYGGVRRDGTPCFPDHAGSGGGTANPEFVARLRDKDRGDESPFSPRNVMRSTYWRTGFRVPADREEILVDELLTAAIGDGGYPGDSTASTNWPGVAPGTSGILNALSPKYCNWSSIANLDPKPPILWTHGDADVIVADTSALELGALGAAGLVPGWPGAAEFPPQPMVSQINDVLDRYAAAGGTVRKEMFAGSGHGPLFDAAEQWRAVFFGFVASAGAA